MLRPGTPANIAPNALVTFTTPIMPMSARSAANHNTASSRRPHRIARKHSPQTRTIHIIVHELGRLDSSVTVTGARPVVDTNNAWRRADGQTQSAEDVIPSITKRPAARRDANILRTRRDALSVASLHRCIDREDGTRAIGMPLDLAVRLDGTPMSISANRSSGSHIASCSHPSHSTTGSKLPKSTHARSLSAGYALRLARAAETRNTATHQAQSPLRDPEAPRRAVQTSLVEKDRTKRTKVPVPIPSSAVTS